jgi:hypothetical protein
MKLNTDFCKLFNLNNIDSAAKTPFAECLLGKATLTSAIFRPGQLNVLLESP